MPCRTLISFDTQDTPSSNQIGLHLSSLSPWYFQQIRSLHVETQQKFENFKLICVSTKKSAEATKYWNCCNDSLCWTAEINPQNMYVVAQLRTKLVSPTVWAKIKKNVLLSLIWSGTREMSTHAACTCPVNFIHNTHVHGFVWINEVIEEYGCWDTPMIKAVKGNCHRICPHHDNCHGDYPHDHVWQRYIVTTYLRLCVL